MVLIDIAIAALALSTAMACAWLAQRRTGQSGWVDSIWSLATGAAAAALALAPAGDGGGDIGRARLVAAMAACWGLRLGLHIAARARRGGEDPRYADLARQWGSDFSRRLFWFLQIQAACALLLAITALVAARNPAPFPSAVDFLGAGLFAIGLLGEAIADRQLASFKADARNAGAVCDSGLWGWSRHPNYFFEWLIWTAFALIAVNRIADYPWGVAALIGPAFMYWLLAHVSGIPPLEAHMARSRGAAFLAYQARVNAFFPGPPRRPDSRQTGRSAS